jgi:eukaryotic-like serine/threonine-protein kinase
MELPNQSATTTDAIPAILQVVRSSRILPQHQFEKLEANIAHGDYPSEPAELSSRLVKEGFLTEYQARQIQKGRSEGLNFGSYIILEFLGKGTMGKVYKARHRMMGRIVALKILDSRYVSRSGRALARFQREMQLVGRLDHPNVVRAFDADRVADCHFIAMEYAAGFTLEDLLKAKGALPPPDVVYYGSQAADGLAHAHERHVLHRDIKPSNLLLIEGRKLKILDFGLGTLLEREDVETALTTAGMAVGTPDYLSPEQARMVKVDGRSDLYSLGCTMYHLLSGQLPFKGESSMDCIVSRITGKAVPISEVRPGLPLRLVETIEKLMATNPADRYQTAGEAADALRSMLRRKNAAPSTSAPSVPVQAVAPKPEPVPKRDAPVEAAPSPPVLARVSPSKQKGSSPRWGGIGRWTNSKRFLPAVAVAAVALIGATIMLVSSSQNEPPAAGQETSQTNNGPILPTAAPAERQSGVAIENPKLVAATNEDIRKSSPVIENPKPAATAVSEVRQPTLVIENPKEGATVDMRADLTGRIESGGWPVIFVQADMPGQPWWCQSHVTNVDGGRFTAKVVFGDDLTPPGTKFRIAGIVAGTREQALKFNVGSKEYALPKGFPQSFEVVVTHR